MAKTITKAAKPVKQAKPVKEKEVSSEMEHTENAPTVDAQQEPKISPAETAKKIQTAAKQSDQYEFDDAEEGRAVFDKLPQGEFVIKEGNRTVIQKL